MALQHLPEMAVFIAEPKRGSRKHFTFDEYLAWFESKGSRRTESEAVEMFLSLCGESAGMARLDAWTKVLEWRAQAADGNQTLIKARKVLKNYTDWN